MASRDFLYWLLLDLTEFDRLERALAKVTGGALSTKGTGLATL
jgi:hypothetical protein